MLPKFSVMEDWGNSGNMTVCFDERISMDLYRHVSSELKYAIPALSREERSSYHLERVVNDVFFGVARKGKLKKNLITGHWFMV